MSSIFSSQGIVFATAMAAVSGTVILLAFRLQKSFPAAQLSLQVNSLPQPPRSCISSDGKKKDKRKKKKKKKVHFAEDVVDPIGNSGEYRKLRCSSSYHHHHHHHRNNTTTTTTANSSSSSSLSPGSDESALMNKSGGKLQHHQMPANRVALYNGILRDRVHPRVAYSY